MHTLSAHRKPAAPAAIALSLLALSAPASNAADAPPRLSP